MDTLANSPTRACLKILFGRFPGFCKTKFYRISALTESRYFEALEKMSLGVAKKYFLLAGTGRYFWPGRVSKVHFSKNGNFLSVCILGLKVGMCGFLIW